MHRPNNRPEINSASMNLNGRIDPNGLNMARPLAPAPLTNKMPQQIPQGLPHSHHTPMSGPPMLMNTMPPPGIGAFSLNGMGQHQHILQSTAIPQQQMVHHVMG